MSLQLKPAPKLAYKLRLFPQMRLSLKLLQLSTLDLREYLQKEIETNPILELFKFPEERRIESEISWDKKEKKGDGQDLIISPISLKEHLLGQLRLNTSSEDEIKIGELIIGNLNNDGYLLFPLEEIAILTKTTIAQVEKVLKLIQSFDPIGVGARDLRECLMVQLKANKREDSLAGKIVCKYLSLLEKKGYKSIAKELKVTLEEVKDAINEITALEPKPGRPFSVPKESIYIVPDIFLRTTKNGYQFQLNEEDLPQLKINPRYLKLLKNKDIPDETKEFIKQKLISALGLIKAIDQRRMTIRKVTQTIIKIQKEATDKGLDFLKPLTLREVAKSCKLHISTISRAVANKFISTPNGCFKLKDFFSRRLKSEKGSVSMQHLKASIRKLIMGEDKSHPLSDREIVDILNKKGIKLCRRTVTKYRKKLRIPPAYLRRESNDG